MTNEDAFLKHLAEHPDDDTTRLVYADWLEEHNDPKARFIRLEFELQRLEETHRRLLEEKHSLQQQLPAEWMNLVAKRYDVWLIGYEAGQKIPVIKVIRELTNLGLADAKYLSEHLPALIVRRQPRFQAEEARKRLLDATAQYQPSPTSVVLQTAGVPLLSALPDNGVSPPMVPGDPETRSTWFDIVLRGYDSANKIRVIRAIREVTNCGLAEGKAISERSLPTTILSYVNRGEAERALQIFSGIADVVIQ